MKTHISYLLLIMLVTTAAAFEIESPEGRVSGITTLRITHDDDLDSISYSVDSSSYRTVCEDCDEYEADIILSDGKHVIRARGYDGSDRFSDSVEVIVGEHRIEIRSPKEQAYSGDVRIDVRTSEMVDKLRVEVDDERYQCENCSRLEKTVSLDDGEYELEATSWLGDDEETASVTFTVEKDRYWVESPVQKTYGWDVTVMLRSTEKIDMGFEVDGIEKACEDCTKLSKVVVLDEGEYELDAWFIVDGEKHRQTVEFTVRDALSWTARLPPGQINRMIKSGKLTQDQIEDILDSQRIPPGIFGKLFTFFSGSYADNIVKHYDVNDSLREKLLERDDLSKESIGKLKQGTVKAHGKKVSVGKQSRS